MPGPLSGVLVLDLTQQLVGPGATMLLGDMGADVIRVEPPPQLSPQRGEGQARARTSLNLGRSKRNISIDLGRREGRDIVYQVARRADVLVHNYRPGLVERLGMGYGTIKQLNPGIVYCGINAYGHTGPERHRVGFDIIGQGGAGAMVPNYRNPDLPAPLSAPIGDVTGMVLAALGVVSALYHRALTGEGQLVQTSLLDAAVLNAILRLISIEKEDREWRLATVEGGRAMMEAGASFADISAALATGMGGQLTGAAGGAAGLAPNIYYRTYRTRDAFIAVGCLNARQQRRLNDALGLGDERYSDGASGAGLTPERLSELQEKAESLFRQKTTGEWLTYLDSQEVACGPVLSVLDLFDSPHHLENQMVIEYDDPIEGSVRALGYPIKFERTPMTMRRPAPTPGQFSDEVMAWLGYTDAQIEALRAERILF